MSTPRVAIAGAGVAGAAAAIRLAERGCRVSVFEAAATAGGLAGGFQVGGCSLERYYHHIFRSDRVAQRWMRDLGLDDRLEFRHASMGFYARGRLLPFGTPWALLRFSPLMPVDRLRLGLRMRWLATTSSPAQFENVTAVQWLQLRVSSAELAVFWMPLLRAKFGKDAEKVSMAWLWARFRARAGSSSMLARERLGYLRGGFQQLADRLILRATDLGVHVHLGTPIRSIGISKSSVRSLSTNEGNIPVDAIIWTPSLNIIPLAVPDLDPRLAETCRRIVYHSAVVTVVVLPRPVLPFYWVTIGDPALPFTVAVEHTRLIPASDYGGRTIVYLARYAAHDEPIMSQSEDSVRDLFLGAAASAFSSAFEKPLETHVFRAAGAQPIVPPGWATARPPLRSGIGGLVLANMAQIYPWDRGINYSLELGEQAASAVLDDVGVR